MDAGKHDPTRDPLALPGKPSRLDRRAPARRMLKRWTRDQRGTSPQAANRAPVLVRRALMNPAKVKEIGISLTGRVVLMAMRRIQLAERIELLVREELAKKRPNVTRLDVLERFMFSNADLMRTFGELNDRFGQPRRTVQDLNVAGGITPLRLVLHDETEAADAARSSDGAGTHIQ